MRPEGARGLISRTDYLRSENPKQIWSTFDQFCHVFKAVRSTLEGNDWQTWGRFR